MPSAAAIARSSGVVMNPLTSSASAPTYTVVTVIEAISLRGYCRTLIVFIACKPAMRITKLTTNASTGRFMKRSVNDFIWVAHAPSRAHFGALAEMRDECPETGLVEHGFGRGRRKHHARARARARNQ